MFGISIPRLAHEFDSYRCSVFASVNPGWHFLCPSGFGCINNNRLVQLTMIPSSRTPNSKAREPALATFPKNINCRKVIQRQLLGTRLRTKSEVFSGNSNFVTVICPLTCLWMNAFTTEGVREFGSKFSAVPDPNLVEKLTPKICA